VLFLPLLCFFFFLLFCFTTLVFFYQGCVFDSEVFSYYPLSLPPSRFFPFFSPSLFEHGCSFKTSVVLKRTLVLSHYSSSFLFRFFSRPLSSSLPRFVSTTVVSFPFFFLLSKQLATFLDPLYYSCFLDPLGFFATALSPPSCSFYTQVLSVPFRSCSGLFPTC
jgi:hypothetical protein